MVHDRVVCAGISGCVFFFCCFCVLLATCVLLLHATPLLWFNTDMSVGLAFELVSSVELG